MSKETPFGICKCGLKYWLDEKGYCRCCQRANYIDEVGLERAAKAISTIQFYSNRERAAKVIIKAYLGIEEGETP